jgi:hypothetical protein
VPRRDDKRIGGHTQFRQSHDQGGRRGAFEQRLDAEGETEVSVDAINQPDGKQRPEAEIGKASVPKPIPRRIFTSPALAGEVAVRSDAGEDATREGTLTRLALLADLPRE